MSKNVRWITETAVMLALLIALQALTKPLGQLVTGSCVNAVLAVACCWRSLAAASPLRHLSRAGFLLGIAPQLVTVPAITVGNTVFVCCCTSSRNSNGIGSRIAAWFMPRGTFATLYILVVKIICRSAAARCWQTDVKEPC